MGPIAMRLADAMGRRWWVLLLRGVLAIGLGVLAWTRPGVTLAALLLGFGFFALADGVLALVLGIAGPSGSSRWALILSGLVGIGVGVLTLANPALTGLALLFAIAAWAIATGVLQVVAALRLRKEIEGEWVYVMGGLLSVALGVYLLARPGSGVVALLWALGLYAVVFGALMVVLAFRVRALGKRLGRAGE